MVCICVCVVRQGHSTTGARGIDHAQQVERSPFQTLPSWIKINPRQPSTRLSASLSLGTRLQVYPHAPVGNFVLKRYGYGGDIMKCFKL